LLIFWVRGCSSRAGVDVGEVDGAIGVDATGCSIEGIALWIVRYKLNSSFRTFVFSVRSSFFRFRAFIIASASSRSAMRASSSSGCYSYSFLQAHSAGRTVEGFCLASSSNSS
jgi:hypothetical protein